MATLPGTPETQPTEAPDVDALFPAKSVDELFPASVERERYRRQTLGTSPIQDLIFGNSEINPVARVLDAFGQGAKHAWGANSSERISKEAEDALKINKQFDSWNEGQNSIIKAANEALFRPAAVQLTKEFHDAEALFRGLGAAFAGTQAAVAQIGEEVGQPKIGREAAAAFEALPTGFRAPTGIPHAPPHPMLGEIRNINSEIAKARELGVIGAGEEGYFGTRPAEVTPPISTPEAAPKPAGMPVDLFAEPKAEAKPTEPAPAAAAETVPAETYPSPERRIEPSPAIATDVAGKLVAAGRPAEEANVSAQVIASHYQARAERFNGELGTAEELYRAEGADIRGGDGKPPVKSEPIRPAPEGDLGTVEPAPKPLPGDAGAAEPINTIPELKTALRGRAAADPQTWSLYEFLASEGGLKPTADLKSIFGGKNPFIPGFGPLLRKGGLTMDEALTRAKENSYVLDPNDIQHVPGAANTGELTRTVNDLQDMVAEESRGRKQYRNTHTPEAKIDPEKVAKDIIDELNNEVEAAGGKVDAALEKRVVEIMTKEGETNVHSAYERAIMEDADRHEDVLNERRQARGEIAGHDHDGRGSSLDGGASAEDSGHPWASEQEAREANVREPSRHGENDRSAELELNQIKRGKINLREDAKPIITLFKDANASTFIHETGHQWLEELMGDAQHPKAPLDLKNDASAVLNWLGVEKATDIKTSHHEKFARGFERYMMEGKAPTQALASVFEKFKDWLTRIYQTVTRLKSPINDEIRGVFDRLISLRKEDVTIEPEGPPKTFADIHEADAAHTAPEAARPVAETIRAERDMLANEHIPEEHDARLEGIASGAGRREAGGSQPVRDGHEARPLETKGGNDQATGALGAGGSDAAPEGPRPSVGGGKTEPPVSAQTTFTGPDSALVDKAGNIRLDNLGTAEDVNKAIRDAAAENNDFIDARRGVVTDGQVLELADALGMDAGQLNTRKLGQAYNAEQIMAARKLLIQSATNVRDAMVRAAQGAEADIMAYAEAKARHQMIQEQVSGITAEAGRALRAFRKLEGQQEAGQINAFLKDATGKTLFQLQREAQLGSQLATPAEVSKFVNDSSKPTWKDKIFELWISFLLSGPKTHAANMIGNTISGLLRPVETALAAGYGKAFSVFGKQDRVLFGEATAELFGAFQGSREGIVAAYKAYKTEEPQLTSVNQIERGHQKALPSFSVGETEIGGKQLRIPLRMLGAEDEFFKATSFRGSINRQAYELAAKENLPPEQFNVRVAELSMNPTEEMVNKAKDAADYLAFQKPLGDTGRKAQNFINSHVALKFVVPFVRTPVNLLKYAGERTPLGVFSAEVRDNLSGKNGAVARDTQLARITLGTMVGVAAFSLANEGLITGGGPNDPKKRAVMVEDGWQPYSVKIGGMYYAYNRLDPFSIIMGVVADAHEIYTASNSTNPEKEHLASLLFAAITKNITDRASLKGPSDLIQAVTNNERYGKSYINGMAGTVIPAFFAQSAQAIDPTIREARTLIDYLKARTPFLSETLHPKRNVWGEPMVREGGFGPDIGSPIMERRIKNDPVNQALLAANYFPAKLDRKIRGVELTDDQYDDYARIAGRMAKTRLNAIVAIPGFSTMPETARKELMTNAITTSRETARSLILMQSPDIIRKAMDAKLDKLRPKDTVH